MWIVLELGWRRRRVLVFWCAVCLLAHRPCYIIRCQWCQFVLNELMILGVRNAIRKCHEMNEGSVIVVLAQHDASIL